MKQKPQPKFEVKITVANAEVNLIHLYASADAIEDFKTFGAVSDFHYTPGLYQLYVDARYDFEEVVAYIEAYRDDESD